MNMKKQLLLFFMMLLPMLVSADAVEIDGIYYNLIHKGMVAVVVDGGLGYYKGDIVIPNEVTYENETYSVTSIGEKAFCDSPATSIILPNSIVSIEDYAFAFCYNLVSVFIPNSVTSIGNYAFQSCNKLLALVIPSSIQYLGEFPTVSIKSSN